MSLTELAVNWQKWLGTEASEKNLSHKHTMALAALYSSSIIVPETAIRTGKLMGRNTCYRLLREVGITWDGRYWS